MPKKPDACWKCKHDIYNDNCMHKSCEDCELYLKKPETGTNGQLAFCKCFTVEDGEECPYYKEA